MRKFIKLAGVVLAVLFLTGCAGLEKIAQDIQEIDATQEISDVSSALGGIIDKPWDEIAFTGLGYVLALLRRKYKISKGAK